MPIPKIDLSAVNIGISDDQLNKADLDFVAEQVRDALDQWGFAYFSGHGISRQQIKDIFRTSQEFFDLPLHVKEKCKRGNLGPETNSGFIKMFVEKLDPLNPYDVREAFDYGYEAEDDSTVWPKEFPKFEQEMKSFFQTCTSLANRVFYIIGIALQLEDPSFFLKHHKCMGSLGNASVLRAAFYPPIDDAENIKPGQLRCSEHTDYGSITLLFQDDTGGLMVEDKNGAYVHAEPVKDALLFNIGDLVQRWTCDEVMAPKHKVIIPEEELRHRRARMAVIFFAKPDNASDVKCINGSNKYPVINAKKHFFNRLHATYY